MSDDDKIRLQLVLDITEFGAQLEQKFNYKGDANFDSLYKLVETINQNLATNKNVSVNKTSDKEKENN